MEPSRYYEACVSDVCACDSGGDCECFCTAVAAYAQACHEAGVCVSWRTPDVCRELGCPWGWAEVQLQPLGGLAGMCAHTRTCVYYMCVCVLLCVKTRQTHCPQRGRLPGGQF